MLAIFIIVYLSFTLLIGVWVSKKVKSAKDFITAGRKLPLVMNTFALFALWYGSETVFGASSEFAEKGLLGVIEDPFGGALCLVLFATFFARPLYRKNFMTLGDLFREKYGARVELIASFFMIFPFIGYIAAQMVALGLLINIILGISVFSGILISAFIVCAYTLTGGMWAVSITDFIQSLVIIVGLLWVAISISGNGSRIVEVFKLAPPGHFRFIPEPTIHSYLEYLAAWMVLGLGSIPSQDVFQRFNAARSEKAAVLSGYLGALLYLLMALLPLFIALTIKVLYPETVFSDNQKTIPEVIMNHSALPIQVMLFGALISAIFSTCSGAILAPASLLSENIIKPIFGMDPDSKKFLWMLRLSVVIISAGGVVMASVRGNIYELVGESSILGLVSMLVPMIYAIWGKHHFTWGPVLSMVSGVVTWFYVAHISPVGIPPLMAGLLVSSITLLAGNILQRKIGRKGFSDEQFLINR